MKKIKDFDKVVASEGGTFKRVPDGGYVVAVKNISDVAEKEYLRIEYDICKGEYKNFYQQEYDKDTRENKRWGGTLIRSYKQTALPMFKGFITSVEKSNKNFEWGWDEKALKNKMFGVVIGTEEYINNNGKLRSRPYVASVHSVEKIESGDFTVPEIKKVEHTQTTTANNTEFVNPFADDNAMTVSTESNPFEDDDTNPFA